MYTSNLLLACGGAFALSVVHMHTVMYECAPRSPSSSHPTRAYRCVWEVVRRALSAGVGEPHFESGSESVCFGYNAFESPNSDRAANRVSAHVCISVRACTIFRAGDTAIIVIDGCLYYFSNPWLPHLVPCAGLIGRTHTFVSTGLCGC